MKKFILNRFLVSRMLAALGDQFMMFAVPLIILKTTGSVKWSGLAFAIEWLPRLLFLPISGSLADRMNVNYLYRFADLGRVILILSAYAFMQLSRGSSFLILGIMMAAISILNSLAFIGMEATLPRQLPAEDLPKAQSWLQGMDQVSQVMGPAIAASAAIWLKVDDLIWVGAGFFALSFLNSVSLPAVDFVAPAKKPIQQIVIESYSRGFQILFQKKLLLQLCALTWIVNLIYGSALVVAPAIVTQTFHQPEKVFGWVQTLSGFFCISVFFVAPRLVKRFGLHGVGFYAFLGMVLGGILSAQAIGVMSFALGLAILMGFDGLFNVFIRSLRAQIIPKEDFGKVTGVIILTNNFSLPISGFLVSIVSSSMSPQAILFGMTGLALVLGLGVILLGRLTLGYRTVMPSIQLSGETS